MPNTLSSPPVIWSAPRPSEVAEPKRVSRRSAMMSMALPGPSVGSAAEQRPEGARHQVSRALAVGEVADCEADDGVHRPGVEAPVEEDVLHRHRAARDPGSPRPSGGLVRCVSGSATPRRSGQCPCQSRTSSTPTRTWRTPAWSRRVEPDVAVAGERQVGGERQERRTDEDEQQNEVVGDPTPAPCRCLSSSPSESRDPRARRPAPPRRRHRRSPCPSSSAQGRLWVSLLRLDCVHRSSRMSWGVAYTATRRAERNPSVWYVTQCVKTLEGACATRGQ